MPYVGKKPADIIATSVDTDTGAFSGNVTAGGTLGVTGETTLATHLNLGDNDKIKLGASGDLEIYHDTNHSYVEDTGTGELRLKTNGTAIRFQHGSETLSLYTEDGSVELYHNDSKKFETTSSGADVSGTTVNINGGGSNPSLNVKNNDTYFSTLSHDSLNVQQNALKIKINGGEKLRVDSSGNVGIGQTSNLARLTVNSGATNASATFISSDAGAYIGFADNSTTLDSGTFPYVFTGAVGNDYIIGTNNSERLRISADGRVGINNTNPNSAMLHADQTASNEQGIFIHPEHTSFTNIGLLVQTIRGQDASFGLIQCKTNSGGDLEFNLRGDGSAYADLNWNGGGADYAEYFEWKDGNTDNEDRRGYTVVLDGNQIRKSTSDDAPSTIIGVVSATPVVVGDNAWNMWNGKYEKDEYGNYIFEEHTVTEWKDGNKTISYHTDKIPSDVTVPDDAIVKTYHVDENDKSTSEKFSRRKESSSYDASKTYISREDRNEWDTIGLVGKLRIRVGQTIGDRWIKMREISDTVHEYLVR